MLGGVLSVWTEKQKFKGLRGKEKESSVGNVLICLSTSTHFQLGNNENNKERITIISLVTT